MKLTAKQRAVLSLIAVNCYGYCNAHTRWIDLPVLCTEPVMSVGVVYRLPRAKAIGVINRSEYSETARRSYLRQPTQVLALKMRTLHTGCQGESAAYYY